MSNNKLFRFAGRCALATVLLTLVVWGFYITAPTSSLILILGVLTMFVLTPVFYALYVFHRSESAGLSLVGLVLWVVAAVLQIVSLLAITNNFLYAIASLVFALPLLVFGFLAYRSTRMPRGLALVTLLTGIVWLILGAVSFNGTTTLAMVGGVASTLFMVVWLVWLWRLFTSGKLVTS